VTLARTILYPDTSWSRRVGRAVNSIPSHEGSFHPVDPAAGRVLVLDGFRGAAVLIYACHNLYAGPSSTHLEGAVYHALRSGWIGVSLFFVLTGFLTTRRLMASRTADPIFRGYYIRRCFRIVPLYYGFLAFWLVAAPWIAGYTPDDLALLRQNQGWYWACLANLRLATHAGNFGAEPTIFWSLAVVVHFYLFWPLIIGIVPRERLPRLCLGLVLGAVLFRVALRAGGSGSRITEAIYTLTPSRMDDLVLGALLALTISAPGAWRRLERWAYPAAGLLTALLAAVFVVHRGIRLDDPWFQTIGYTMLSATAAAYIFLALRSRADAPGRRILQSRFLTSCGRWSYGIYVWHGALFYAVSHEPWFVHASPLAGSRLLGSLVTTFVLLATGIALGALSWRLYEAPFVRWGRRIAPPVTLHPDRGASGSLPRTVA
jgi:peptidoglycan/LPS O-acetylase OafA/YrhL